MECHVIYQLRSPVLNAKHRASLGVAGLERV